MADGTKALRYCAIVQLSKGSDMARVAESVPWIVSLIDRWSKKEMEQLCRSNDGQLFGFVFKTTKPVEMLRSEFETCGGTNNQDSIIIFEVGTDLASVGFTRAGTWLQRH